jgi:hypothetical protein
LEAEEPQPAEHTPVPSRHELTLGQEFRGVLCRFVLDWASSDVVEQVGDNEPIPAKFRLRFVGQKPTMIVNLEEVRFPTENDPWRNPVIPKSVLEDGYPFEGSILRSDEKISGAGTISHEDLEVLLERNGYSPDLIRPDGSVGLLWVAPGGQCDLAFRIGRKDAGCRWATTMSLRLPELTDRLPVEHLQLRAKKVAVIGLGSAGSKIAEWLARAGVGAFLLVDDDLFVPSNLVRHTLDWRSVGAHKVDAIAEALLRIDPELKINARRMRMDGQEASAGAAGLDNQLGDCDLIVDATASPTGFNRVANVAAASGTPLA